MTHQDYKEMISAYALSALDAPNDSVLSTHLNECAECRQEFDEWKETSAAIALDAKPLEPSTQLRDRILTQARADKVSVSRPNVIPLARKQKNVWSSLGTLGAIAASLLFLALLVNVVLLWREKQAVQSELETLRAEVSKTKKDLDEQTRIIQMFAKPGTRFAELTAMPIAPAATAKLAYDSAGHAMIMTNGLPAPPAGKAYQLWFIVGGKPMPGKTFSTDSSGKAMMEDQIPAVAMNSAVFAITLEPKEGVAAPTGSMYLRS